MAPLKFLVLSIFLALIFTKTTADAGVHDENITPKVSDSSLKMELEHLKSKISVLESNIEEKTRELKSKDESIAQMEKTVQEKSDSTVSLQSKIDLLQKKGTLDAEEQMGKVHARAGELVKQVEKLKRELEVQKRNKEALAAQGSQAEKKIDVLNMKLENLQKINDEQKIRIRKTEHALQIAEEEMMKTKFEANSKIKELMELVMAEHWNKHGKPAMDIVVEKASDKKAQVHKWAEPHIETVETRWIPTLKEQWLTFTAYVEPHVQLATKRSIEVYETSKSAIAPYVVQIQEFSDPYLQEAKKFTMPYIDQVATAAKPHVDKAWVALKPYTKKVVHSYEKFLESASTYHLQALVLLALPIIILIRLFSAIFCKKAKKPARNAHTSHTRRRAKRGYPDK
ncbi:uncharacterized protein LOC122658706 isoform X2 [Telopea speciosissima]|uniref:uncharacterized protein LOC122658706 isoform X2 n=1 Tax=Telopea speciosissima TaxID=54955 RepID=UPI001CC6B50D|nr:uncharacterized protein LOC122658706 isoform X2 [Telopea speciosissima]